MKYFLSVLFAFTITSSIAQHTFFKKADTFFKANVEEGLVAYQAIYNEPNQLNTLVETIGQVNVSSWDEDEQKAFYINSYNILTIHSVIEHFPIQSPLDKEGFFDKQLHKVAGEQLTLNQIENEKLRKPYQDERVHFVLVCAALGCPKLANQAYLPETVDNQLHERTKETLNDTRFIRVDAESEKVFLSEIFKWYKDDFFWHYPSLKAYLKHYRNKGASIDDFELDYYAYDWRLNKK